MWSDSIVLPPQLNKHDADIAEVAVAAEQTSLGRARRTAAHCRTFWPSPHQVCGAILQRYEQLGGMTSWLLWPIEPMSANPDGQGYRQRYQNGFIYWHPDTGAHAVAVRNAEVWARNGWETGWLGYPLGGEVPVKGSQPVDGELNGWVQHFQGGRIYRSPLQQVASINGLILEEWLEMGGPNSYLGFPIADEAKTADSIGRFSVFQDGEMYWHPDAGTWGISGPFLFEWAKGGRESGTLGYPSGTPVEEVLLQASQPFQNGLIRGYFEPINKGSVADFDHSLVWEFDPTPLPIIDHLE
ncbi:LGFP repeat-containing protein [Corynebacterium nasicanis]|uniref:LGFP repeat-containing protein n=1 Tax=Corynebacterium nasicanis TaxID=1448267 RepID=A0ABW1QDB1_9CORY